MSVYARRAVLAFMTLSLMAGCAGEDKGPPTAPVTGKVIYKSAPVVGATVTFRVDNEKEPSLGVGTTDAQGIYEIRTGAVEGAVLGNHLVTVTKIPAASGDYAKTMGIGGQAAAPPKNELPEKYADPATSGFKFTVKSGKNEFPLELTD